MTKLHFQTIFGLRKSFPHSNFYAFEQPESAEFFRRIFTGAEIPQPRAEINNDFIKIKAVEENGNVEFCYTCDDVKTTEIQTWQSVFAADGTALKIPMGVVLFSFLKS